MKCNLAPEFKLCTYGVTIMFGSILYTEEGSHPISTICEKKTKKKNQKKTKNILLLIFKWLIQKIFYLAKQFMRNTRGKHFATVYVSLFRYSPVSPGKSFWVKKTYLRTHSGSLFMFGVRCMLRRSLLSGCSPIHNTTEIFHFKDTFLH